MEGKGWHVHDLKAAQRDIFMQHYNSTDPPTEWVVEHVYVLTHPAKPVVLVVIVKDDDCVLDVGALPPEELQKILHGPDNPT